MKSLVEKLEKTLMVSVLGLALLTSGSAIFSGTNSFALPKDGNSQYRHFAGAEIGCPNTGNNCVVITVWG